MNQHSKKPASLAAESIRLLDLHRRHALMATALTAALIGSTTHEAQAIDVFIGSAYNDQLEQLANNPDDWDYVASRAGIWLHPGNKNTTLGKQLVTQIAGHLTHKWAVIERNRMPDYPIQDPNSYPEIDDFILWAKNTIDPDPAGPDRRLFFYFNGSETPSKPDNFVGAAEFAVRANYVRSKGVIPWMGVAPHVVLRNDGWDSPYFDLAKQYTPVWDGFAYDCQQDTYEFDADFRKAFYDASLTASSNGKYNVPILSTHRTVDDAFLGGQHEIRDLRNKPGTNVQVIGIDDYTRDALMQAIPETLPDGSCARTITGLARWIYLYYDGALTALNRQGESGTSQSDVVDSSANPNYEGTGYADFGGAGSWLQWSNVLHETNFPTGKVRLIFRYAAGSNERPCTVTVNGVNAGSVSMPSTGSWTTWQTATINDVVLKKGNNIIRLTAGSNGGPNLDEMDVIFAPLAPTGVVVDEQASQNVIKWTKSLGASSYRVKRATSKSGPFTQIATGLTGTSYTDTAVNSGTVYFYSVSAHKSNGLDSMDSEVTEEGLISRFKPVAVKKDPTPNTDIDLVQPGHPAEHGNDDDPTTYWGALEYTYPQPWRINLQIPKKLDRIAIKWYGVGTNRQYKYRVDVSNDNINFTTVVPEKWNGAADTLDTLNTTGRHVRVAVTDTNTTNARAALYEAKVYGD